MSDLLNDFIQRQHERDLSAEARWTRVETLLEQNSQRLFGGDGQEGALPFIMKKQEQNAATAAEQCAKVEVRTAVLEGWKKSSLAWIAGVVAVLTMESTALAVYFNSVANHIKSVAGR